MNSNFKSIPDFGVGLRIENEPLPTSDELDGLVSEINECIQNMEEEGLNAFIRKKDDKSVTFKDTYNLFRRKERIANIRLILEYMVGFLISLPSRQDAVKLPENPFHQFRDFVLALINDLKEDDVVDAILNEYGELGVLTEKNRWMYKGKTRVFHDLLKESLRDVSDPGLEEYKKLFNVLKKISLFWFDIRRENLSRIRKSDLLIYKIARVLLDKLENSKYETD